MTRNLSARVARLEEKYGTTAKPFVIEIICAATGRLLDTIVLGGRGARQDSKSDSESGQMAADGT